MKKLLMLNGSHSEISMIEAAKALGYYVITTGNNPNLIGHKYANEYIFGDYSDKEAMLKLAQKEKIQSVVSCANDFGIITASYIAEKIGIEGYDSYETTLLLHQKDRFKKFALENGMQVPRSVTFSNKMAAIEYGSSCLYPVIIKPVDLTGGKGVSKVSEEGEYELAINMAFERSREKRIVVEQFIEGTYHSFSTFLIGKKVIAYYSDNEYPYLNPYFVSTSGGPASYVNHVKDILIHQAELAAEKLNLVNGVFHMQYVMDKSKIPYVIDITRRCSGDLYPEPVEHSTGLPWSKWIVMSECGFPENYFSEQGTQRKYCGRHCIMAQQKGKVSNVKISEDLAENIYKEVQWWNKGYQIDNYLVDKVGVLFYEFTSEEEMLNKIRHVNELVKVELM